MVIWFQYCPNVDFKISCNRLRDWKLGKKMSKIDLNLEIALHHSETWKGRVHEHWPHGFCSVDGPASACRIPALGRPLRGRLQGSEFLLPRSVSVFGFRAAHLSRQSARYRN